MNYEQQLNDMLDAMKSSMPKVAEIIKTLYDSLLAQGFTPEQAIEICTKYQVK